MDATVETALEEAILGSLDDLLRTLRPEPAGPGRYRFPVAAVEMFDRIYGGQLLAQAVMAAGADVAGKQASSLHAVFVKAGEPGRSIEAAVDSVRDGRSMSTRQVTLVQDGRPLLVALASFHAESPEAAPAADAGAAPPPAGTPGDQPRLQDWAARSPTGRHWIDRPPAVEIRMDEAPTFLGGHPGRELRSHWMRLPRDVGADQLLHRALLAYSSDFFLMDMIFRAHPDRLGPGGANGLSLDHGLWFHRAADFTHWHTHTQEAVVLVGERGLARGMIHDADGRLVATVSQEVLVRARPSR